MSNFGGTEPPVWRSDGAVGTWGRSLCLQRLMRRSLCPTPTSANGDAAHCCHQLGQGLNMGIRDAAALAQVLQSAHRGWRYRRFAGTQTLWTLAQAENLTILGFTDLLDRIFSNNWLPVVVVRRLGLWMLRRIPPLKTFTLKLMTD